MLQISTGEMIIAIATVMGPILAVQAQKAVERASRTGARQVHIFETLMSTFATRLANEHVQALNLIELAFRPRGRLAKLFGFNQKRNRKVLEAWRTYSVNLFANIHDFSDAQLQSHAAEGNRLFKDLMYKMSDALDYGLTTDILAKGVYYPTGNQERERALLQILVGASKVFSNEQSIGMNVTHFPVNTVAAQLQIDSYQSFVKLADELIKRLENEDFKH